MKLPYLTLLTACLGLGFHAASSDAKEPQADTKEVTQKAAPKKQGKTIRGQVNRLDSEGETKILHIGLGGAKTKMYKTNEATKMLILGKPGTFDDLKQGMHVAVLSAFESGSATEKPKTLIYLVAVPNRNGLKPYRNWDSFEEQWAKSAE